MVYCAGESDPEELLGFDLHELFCPQMHLAGSEHDEKKKRKKNRKVDTFESHRKYKCCSNREMGIELSIT